MKRFVVFAFDDFYPVGGTGDISASFDTLDEARRYARHLRYDNLEILDRIEGSYGDMELDDNEDDDE